jgi:hypothetical protein
MYLAEVNAAFAAMYGYAKPEDVIGLRLRDFHVADSEVNKGMMRAHVENGHCSRSGETEEVGALGCDDPVANRRVMG